MNIREESLKCFAEAYQRMFEDSLIRALNNEPPPPPPAIAPYSTKPRVFTKTVLCCNQCPMNVRESQDGPALCGALVAKDDDYAYNNLTDARMTGLGVREDCPLEEA